MYSLLRKALFKLEPEIAHDFSLDVLGASERLKLIQLLRKTPVSSTPRQVMGLSFPNPVGLAAGLDKNGDYFNALGALGFGFVEIGTVTPLPQDGNPKPRMFRLEEEQAIINRMGFNNNGVDYLVKQAAKRRYNGVLGINIGKNKQTPEASALSDYSIGMEKVYPYADYISINISSPNTPGLRNLQFGEVLNTLLKGLQDKRSGLSDAHGRRVPIAVKIAPDSTADELKAMAEAFVRFDIDAVIATNTTITRDAVQQSKHADEQGGLSGKPLSELSTQTISTLKTTVGDDLAIIGVGGIFDVESAQDKIEAGADLVQIYSGFIYEGPQLIADLVEGLLFTQ